MKREYKGYYIALCDDGTFDVVDSCNELVDGCYQSIEEAEMFIDLIKDGGKNDH